MLLPIVATGRPLQKIMFLQLAGTKPMYPGSIKESLERLISDETSREQMAEAALNRVKRFMWENVANQCIEASQKICRRN